MSAGVRAGTIQITNESGATATGNINLGANNLAFSIPTGTDHFFSSVPER